MRGKKVSRAILLLGGVFFYHKGKHVLGLVVIPSTIGELGQSTSPKLRSSVHNHKTYGDGITWFISVSCKAQELYLAKTLASQTCGPSKIKLYYYDLGLRPVYGADKKVPAKFDSYKAALLTQNKSLNICV